MGLYDENPGLEALHQRWIATQARMLDAHQRERLASQAAARIEVVRSRPVEVPLAELQVIAELAREAAAATEEWGRVHAAYAAARDQWLELRRIRENYS